MGDPKTTSVEFRSLAVGQRFWIYGDSDLNYGYPKVCECIKDTLNLAHEVGSEMTFRLSGESLVSIDKAAFEAQQKPPRIAHTKEVRELLGIPEPNPIGYIAVAPDDHAELIRKSDLYNECKAVIERLSCEIEDLKKRFV